MSILAFLIGFILGCILLAFFPIVRDLVSSTVKEEEPIEVVSWTYEERRGRVEVTLSNGKTYRSDYGWICTKTGRDIIGGGITCREHDICNAAENLIRNGDLDHLKDKPI